MGIVERDDAAAHLVEIDAMAGLRVLAGRC